MFPKPINFGLLVWCNYAFFSIREGSIYNFPDICIESHWPVERHSILIPPSSPPQEMFSKNCKFLVPSGVHSDKEKGGTLNNPATPTRLKLRWVLNKPFLIWCSQKVSHLDWEWLFLEWCKCYIWTTGSIKSSTTFRSHPAFYSPALFFSKILLMLILI